MTTAQITQLVISLAPSVIAILTMVGVVLRTLHAFTSLKKEVTDMKAVQDISDQLRGLTKENHELKKQLNELLTKIDHVERK